MAAINATVTACSKTVTTLSVAAGGMVVRSKRSVMFKAQARLVFKKRIEVAVPRGMPLGPLLPRDGSV